MLLDPSTHAAVRFAVQGDHERMRLAYEAAGLGVLDRSAGGATVTVYAIR